MRSLTSVASRSKTILAAEEILLTPSIHYCLQYAKHSKSTSMLDIKEFQSLCMCPAHCATLNVMVETHAVEETYATGGQVARIVTFATRRVAVYLETHGKIGSKRAFPIGVLNRWHNCLLIYWRNVAQLPRPHRFVYFCVMTQQDVHGDRQRLLKIWICTFQVRSVQSRGKTLNWF